MAAAIMLLELELPPELLPPELLPATWCWPGGGGGVLQAAVSASDQILGLAADDEVGEESCCWCCWCMSIMPC